MKTGHTKQCDAESATDRAAPDGMSLATSLPAEEKFDFWRAAHRDLRGRYRMALLIAAGGAVTGALVGSMLGQRLYSTTGVVRIASVLPQVLKETDQNRPMALFDGFIDAQRELMSSREMIQAAMKEEPWLKMIKNGPALTEEQFAASLKVETRPKSDYLRATFKNKNPLVAAAAVRSLIGAYQQAFTREQQRADGQRMNQLQSRRASLSAELKTAEDSINTIAKGRPVAAIEPMYLAVAERVKKLRSALADVQSALAGGPDSALRQMSSVRSPGEISEDEILRSYAAEQARVEIQLAQARSRGLGPGHVDVMRLTAMAQECREQMTRFRAAREQSVAARDAAPTPMSLREREANLLALIEPAENEVTALAADRTQLKTLEEQAAAVRQKLAETDARLDALATEASTGGRLTIVTSGDKPMTALLDNRAKTAALGAMAGVAIPFAGLLLRGARRRRYRFSDEMAGDVQHCAPFVAALPLVSGQGELASAAARGIHDLRVWLQPRSTSERRTYLITSCTAGEGKSSVATALALSFAATGYRTLVIDADMGTRRLTHQFESDESAGMIEATAGEEPVIRRVRAGLSVMPAGRCGPQETFRLSPASAERLLATVRERFDVILIDCDPLLTGLSASVIAPHVDGTILVVGHGQEQAVGRKAVKYIEMLGASVSAAIFNRADASEFRAILGDQIQVPGAAERVLPERLSRFGPLVGATLASLLLTREEDLNLIPAGLSLAKSDQPQRAVA